ncbi:hypothetical protein OYC64_019583 [Pagothenia borchgrevinki]|uniref:Uncharacterized protein n=1 Tax=Pagothenia borchgrevinki TaxID=8213 RepID=A0ABD2FIP7_PAGBO
MEKQEMGRGGGGSGGGFCSRSREVCSTNCQCHPEVVILVPFASACVVQSARSRVRGSERSQVGPVPERAGGLRYSSPLSTSLPTDSLSGQLSTRG